jgi:demethylmacrocin O-methyltransferase
MTINELAIKNNTDKSSLDHNYTQHYQKYFDMYINNPKKILELGIYTTGAVNLINAGASLRTWAEYYKEAEIIGLDITDYSAISKTNEYPNITTFACNGELRTSEDFKLITNPWLRELYTYPEMVGGKIGLDSAIKEFGDNYDIIIDDGPHTMSSQQIFLGYMFKHLKSGGLFVVEDLFTSYSRQMERTGQLQFNSFPRTEKNTLWVFQNYIKTGKIESDFMSSNEIEYLNNNIKELYIEKGKNSEICFIVKK